jgi:hypothetical protein
VAGAFPTSGPYLFGFSGRSLEGAKMPQALAASQDRIASGPNPMKNSLTFLLFMAISSSAEGPGRTIPAGKMPEIDGIWSKGEWEVASFESLSSNS